MKSSSNRVALFLPLLVGGGAERVFLNLAHGLISKGVEVDLVLGKAEGLFLEQLPETARLVDLKAKRVLTSLPGLIRYLRRERPRVMISALDHANIVAIWARSLARVPTTTVVTLHTTISKRNKPSVTAFKQRMMLTLIRLFYPRANQLVAVSNGVGRDYAQTIGIPMNRITVIYNPVVTPGLLEKAKEPLTHSWFKPNEPPVILSVGRLSEPKNYALLIRAFAEVVKKHPARLMILGEGELRRPLEELVCQLGLEEAVAMPGFVTNPYKYMAHAAVFVLSSNREGLPTVLIEALALGPRIVSTNCESGPEEILMGGKLGTLVPVDDVHQMAKAIEGSLFSNQQTNEKAVLEQYEPGWAADEYLKIIEGASCG